MHAEDRLATLLELHDAHANNIKNSSGYRGDDFKPSGGTWNDYGMKEVTDSTSTTNFNDYDNTNSGSESTIQRGMWNRDITETGANSHSFRVDSLLPSGGRFHVPDRAIDAAGTYSDSLRYARRAADSTTFTISYPHGSSPANWNENLDSIYKIYTKVEETTFKTNELYVDGRFNQIGETNNKTWTNYTKGIESDLKADGESKIFSD